MSVGRILTQGLGNPFAGVQYLVTLGFGTSGTPPIPPAPVADSTPFASNWQGYTHPKRLSKEELQELVRKQRIALGILPPDLPGQAIAPVADIAKEVAASVNDQIVMADIPIDYHEIYKAAYLEAEIAIHEYKRLKRRRKIAMTLLH